MTATFTFDSDIISDLHKDAYGFRPSADFFATWDSWSDVQKQACWDSLLATLEASIERDRREQDRAVVAFEELVSRTIASGAKSREQALRWIMQASICNGDWEFLCYEHGLPYGYFSPAVALAA